MCVQTNKTKSQDQGKLEELKGSVLDTFGCGTGCMKKGEVEDEADAVHGCLSIWTSFCWLQGHGLGYVSGTSLLSVCKTGENSKDRRPEGLEGECWKSWWC